MNKGLQPYSAKRPTQNDVAKLAGVSRGTVSYVVNGLADGKVAISPETQARVWQAVEELGYVPDAGARALRSGASYTLGLIILDLRNPHFWETAEGVEQEARGAGYRLLLSSMALNAEYGQDIFKDLSSRRIDALILMGALMDQSEGAHEILEHCLRRRLPVVEMSDKIHQDPRVDCVFADYRAAAAAAMEHLFGLGHRRIGMIYGVTQAVTAPDRLETYYECLREAGLAVEPALVANCGPEIEDGYQAARQLLSLPERPTAILAINDLLALGVLRAAGDTGLRVPDDLSLIGFDDTLMTRYLVPRLTTASKDSVRLGREAVRLVLARLQDPTLPRQVVQVPSQLVIRESTAPPRR